MRGLTPLFMRHLNFLLLDDDMFTNMHACKDEYPLVHGDTYDIRNNYPYESYHNYGGNYSPTEHHAPNMQLVYCV